MSAEAAVVIPVLASFAVACVWLLSLAIAQARATDAAREIARNAARGDSSESALALGERIAPKGAEVELSQRGEEIHAEVRVEVPGPLGLFRLVHAPTVKAAATAIKEWE